MSNKTVNTISKVCVIGSGTMGAASATLVSYFIFIVATALISFRYFSFKIDYTSIMRFILYSVIMLAGVWYIDFGSNIINLIVKVFVGAVVYLLLIIGFERDIKNAAVSMLKTKFMKKWSMTVTATSALDRLPA